MTHDRVAVVTVNYRRPHDTIECLDSLRAIAHPLDIICVENGSGDDSATLLNGAHPSVLLLTIEENDGYVPAADLAIRTALDRGADWVWELNNDTVVYPDTLDELLRTARANPRAGAVGTWLRRYGNPDEIDAYGGGQVNLTTGKVWHVVEPGPVDYLTGASILHRRQALLDVPRFSAGFRTYFEDTDFCFRLRKSGWEIAVADRAVVLHRLSATTIAGSPTYERAFCEGAVRFFRRHARFPILPVTLNLVWRLVRRILKRRLPEARAVAGAVLKYGALR